LKRLHTLAFTHNNVELDEIGKFHIEDAVLKERLVNLKLNLGLNELMYLSTCNRVELIFTSDQIVNKEFLYNFFNAFDASWDALQIGKAIEMAEVFQGEAAVEHIFRVASSLDSLVIGEREIITQVRKAYEKCKEFGITGDVIRLLSQHTIQVAKKVYTESDISKNPVSIVSLAYHKLIEKNIKKDANFLIVGAGKTITTMLKFLSKHGYENYTIFNRSEQNAIELVEKINLKASIKKLSDLASHKADFDVIITCTGASSVIFSEEIYTEIIGDDLSKKIVIDLALPADFDEKISEQHNIEIIAIKDLKMVANENLAKRAKEISKCQIILNNKLLEFKEVEKVRKLEIAMSEVPITIKNITSKAYSEVFAKDLEGLDNESRDVLDKFVTYLEKKYISVPMKMAKEILLKQNAK
jgi:glutamyl-tRNA reductase